jgi:hypothetical protein
MIITVQKMILTKNKTGSLSHVKSSTLFLTQWLLPLRWSYEIDLIAILRTGVRAEWRPRNVESRSPMRTWKSSSNWASEPLNPPCYLCTYSRRTLYLLSVFSCSKSRDVMCLIHIYVMNIVYIYSDYLSVLMLKLYYTMVSWCVRPDT